MQELILHDLKKNKDIFSESEIKQLKSISGGSIHKAWYIELENGNQFFAKTTSRERFEMFQYEVDCLKALRKFNNKEFLKIPFPIAIKKLENISILILPWLDLRNENQTNLGKGLALLHQVSGDSSKGKFGWENKGFIGSNLQKGGWMKNWGEFFVELRLKPQLSLATEKGIIKGDFHKLLNQISSLLNDHEPKPALVHGDLWGGNVATTNNQKGVIFDPASYWADKEVDIAMTYLFGGFSNDFYDGYQQILPKSNLSIERRNIYNLYHLLNHANIFGGIYITQSLTMIKNLNNQIIP